MNPQNGRKNEMPRQLTQGEISERFESLVKQSPELGKDKYVERIAVLLDNIGCQDKILETIKSGIHDIWLPMPKECQPSALGPTASKHFHSGQHSLLSDSFVIQKRDNWPGNHVNLTVREDRRWNIPESLEFVDALGEGGCGEVMEVRCIDGEAYALKRIARETTKKKAQDQMEYVKKELNVLRQIRHQHFIRLVGSYTDWWHIGILMHPVAEHNLEDYLENFEADSKSESLLAGFFGCLATALTHLHYVEDVRHKDIKPQNILVHGQNILFTDFGMALDCDELGRTTTNQEKLRSPIYCAPEAAQERPRNTRSDVWSLGCVFLEMATVLRGRPRKFVRDTLSRNGTNTYWNNAQGIREVIKELRGDVSDWGDEPLTWVELMLKEKSEDRPTSRFIREMILQAKGRGKRKYCGYCCTTGPLFTRKKKNADDGKQDAREARHFISGSHEKDNLAATTQAQNQIQEAKVFNQVKLTWGEVQLKRDPGCSHNCVSPEIVARFNLQTREEDGSTALTYEESTIVSRKWATIRWIESYAVRTQRADFLVAPEAMPFQMLLGASL